MAEASMMAMDPSMVRPSLRPSTFPRRMQQERACSSALAPGPDAMYWSSIVYYCPRAPSVPRLLLVICSRGVAMAARGLRGRQAHRTAPHCTAIQHPVPLAHAPPSSQIPMPFVPFAALLSRPVASLLFPSLAFGAHQLLRAAPTPCNVPCLSTTVCCWYGRMVVVSTVDRSTTTILRTAVEW